MKELAADALLRASGSIVEVPYKERGRYLTIGSPIKFSDLEPEITGSPLLVAQVVVTFCATNLGYQGCFS